MAAGRENQLGMDETYDESEDQGAIFVSDSRDVGLAILSLNWLICKSAFVCLVLPYAAGSLSLVIENGMFVYK